MYMLYTSLEMVRTNCEVIMSNEKLSWNRDVERAAKTILNLLENSYLDLKYDTICEEEIYDIIIECTKLPNRVRYGE